MEKNIFVQKSEQLKVKSKKLKSCWKKLDIKSARGLPRKPNFQLKHPIANFLHTSWAAFQPIASRNEDKRAPFKRLYGISGRVSSQRKFSQLPRPIFHTKISRKKCVFLFLNLTLISLNYFVQEHTKKIFSSQRIYYIFP